MRVDRKQVQDNAGRIADGAARVGMALDPKTIALLAAFASIRTHIDDAEDRSRREEQR